MTFTPIRNPALGALMARVVEAIAALDAVRREIIKLDSERKE